MRGKVVINLKVLKSNAELIRKAIPKETKIFWVVKADAYGHGILQTVKTLSDSDGFCVATVDEGLKVRRCSSSPVLLLGKTDCMGMKKCVEKQISLSIWTEEDLENLIRVTDDMNKCAGVHIALNTGMNRIGVKDNKLLYKLINKIKSLPKIKINGVFSHLYNSCNDKTNLGQLSVFEDLTKKFSGKFLMHLSASGKAYDKSFQYDAVRVGLALYGYGIDGVKPCMSVLGEVVCVNLLNSGESVGYGGEYVATKQTFIATLSLGYADGIGRKRKGGEVVIRDKKYKIVGNVCMDFCFAEVDEWVKPEDEVVFLGGQNECVITAEDVAKWEETISYEILTSVKRIKKIYVR